MRCKTLPANVSFTQGAMGEPKPQRSGVGATKARVNGDYKRMPFFRDGKPITKPHVLSSAERASAMQSQAR